MSINKMERNSRPTTNWHNKKRKISDGEIEIDNLLMACIGDAADQKPNTADKVQTGCEHTDKIVSIRCRRHKKRFNVERSWLDTCKWLCPKCYEKLSLDERLKYSPKDECSDVRPKESGKPVVYAKFQQPVIDNSDARDEEQKIDSNEQGRVDKEKTHIVNASRFDKVSDDKIVDKDVSSTILSPSLMALLPDWRMECQKCGQIVPVHKAYIDNTSSVLCPSCSSHMNAIEIEKFNSIHSVSKSHIYHVRRSVVADIKTEPQKELRLTTKPIPFGDSSDIAAGGFYSNSRIMQMSVEELSDAVRKGKISKARARIEIGRRRNREYYNSLPEVEVVAPIMKH